MNNQTGDQNSFLISLKEMSTATYSKDLEPKQELYLEMSRISEAGYCTGWGVGIEFFLWQAITDRLQSLSEEMFIAWFIVCAYFYQLRNAYNQPAAKKRKTKQVSG